MISLLSILIPTDSLENVLGYLMEVLSMTKNEYAVHFLQSLLNSSKSYQTND